MKPRNRPLCTMHLKDYCTPYAKKKKTQEPKNKYSTSNLAVTRGIQDTLEAKVL